jgi:hypothetical protein
MAGITTYLSVIPVNVNRLNSTIITDCWIGLKTKTQPFVAYKKYIPLAKTNTGLFQANGAPKQAGAAKLTSGNTDFQTKISHKPQRGSIHTD